MKTISLLLLGAYLPAVLATAEVSCVDSRHCKDGNEYTLAGKTIGDQSESSICGSIQSSLKEAIKRNGSKTILRSINCSTRRQNGGQSVLVAHVKMDKQSPDYQSSLLTGAVITAFGGSGVYYTQCKTSGLPK